MPINWQKQKKHFKLAETEFNEANRQFNEFNLNVTKQQSKINGLRQELDFKTNQLNDLKQQIESNTSHLTDTLSVLNNLPAY